MAPRGRPVTLSDRDLLAKAEEVFLERGLDATTAEIARRARISESVIFHRYKTKEALFLAVLERHLVPAPEIEGVTALVGKGEIAEHLFDLGTALIDKMKTVHPLFMLAFSSPIKMNELHERVCGAHPVVVHTIKMLAGYFEAEIRLGRLRRVDAEILAHTFLGSVREYVMAEYFERTSGPLPLPAATYLRGMIDVVLAGANGSETTRPPALAGGRQKRR
jgi:AcrR family transcriptional regulator